uniref:Uncharacterized protein n=1 Tax=Acrobeloides nanus TaxID=290746 RepID=A0A914E4I1_9BILA
MSNPIAEGSPLNKSDEKNATMTMSKENPNLDVNVSEYSRKRELVHELNVTMDDQSLEEVESSKLSKESDEVSQIQVEMKIVKDIHRNTDAADHENGGKELLPEVEQWVENERQEVVNLVQRHATCKKPMLEHADLINKIQKEKDLKKSDLEEQDSEEYSWEQYSIGNLGKEDESRDRKDDMKKFCLKSWKNRKKTQNDFEAETIQLKFESFDSEKLETNEIEIPMKNESVEEQNGKRSSRIPNFQTSRMESRKKTFGKLVRILEKYRKMVYTILSNVSNWMLVFLVISLVSPSEALKEESETSSGSSFGTQLVLMVLSSLVLTVGISSCDMFCESENEIDEEMSIKKPSQNFIVGDNVWLLDEQTDDWEEAVIVEVLHEMYKVKLCRKESIKLISKRQKQKLIKRGTKEKENPELPPESNDKVHAVGNKEEMDIPENMFMPNLFSSTSEKLECLKISRKDIDRTGTQLEAQLSRIRGNRDKAQSRLELAMKGKRDEAQLSKIRENRDKAQMELELM